MQDKSVRGRLKAQAATREKRQEQKQLTQDKQIANIFEQFSQIITAIITPLNDASFTQSFVCRAYLANLPKKIQQLTLLANQLTAFPPSLVNAHAKQSFPTIEETDVLDYVKKRLLHDVASCFQPDNRRTLTKEKKHYFAIILALDTLTQKHFLSKSVMHFHQRHWADVVFNDPESTPEETTQAVAMMQQLLESPLCTQNYVGCLLIFSRHFKQLKHIPIKIIKQSAERTATQTYTSSERYYIGNSLFSLYTRHQITEILEMAIFHLRKVVKTDVSDEDFSTCCGTLGSLYLYPPLGVKANIELAEKFLSQSSSPKAICMLAGLIAEFPERFKNQNQKAVKEKNIEQLKKLATAGNPEACLKLAIKPNLTDEEEYWANLANWLKHAEKYTEANHHYYTYSFISDYCYKKFLKTFHSKYQRLSNHYNQLAKSYQPINHSLEAKHESKGEQKESLSQDQLKKMEFLQLLSQPALDFCNQLKILGDKIKNDLRHRHELQKHFPKVTELLQQLQIHLQQELSYQAKKCTDLTIHLCRLGISVKYPLLADILANILVRRIHYFLHHQKSISNDEIVDIIFHLTTIGYFSEPDIHRPVELQAFINSAISNWQSLDIEHKAKLFYSLYLLHATLPSQYQADLMSKAIHLAKLLKSDRLIFKNNDQKKGKKTDGAKKKEEENREKRFSNMIARTVEYFYLFDKDNASDIYSMLQYFREVGVGAATLDPFESRMQQETFTLIQVFCPDATSEWEISGHQNKPDGKSGSTPSTLQADYRFHKHVPGEFDSLKHFLLLNNSAVEPDARTIGRNKIYQLRGFHPVIFTPEDLEAYSADDPLVLVGWYSLMKERVKSQFTLKLAQFNPEIYHTTAAEAKRTPSSASLSLAATSELSPQLVSNVQRLMSELCDRHAPEKVVMDCYHFFMQAKKESNQQAMEDLARQLEKKLQLMKDPAPPVARSLSEAKATVFPSPPQFPLAGLTQQPLVVQSLLATRTVLFPPAAPSLAEVAGNSVVNEKVGELLLGRQD